MTGYGLFQPSTLGMMGQSKALANISTNIANVSTGGYKATDTQFQTLISKTLDKQSDLGGIKPIETPRIDRQGLLNSTSRDLDLAIVGDGFFSVSPTLAVTGEILYTRDGSFQINVAGPTSTAVGADGNPITISNGYLTDKNGYYVLGIPKQTNGTFPTSASSPQPMRVDPFAFVNQTQQTTTTQLSLNLPAQKDFGDAAEVYNIGVVDSNGAARSIDLNFSRSAANNTWGIIPTGQNSTSLSLTGTAFSLATGAGNRLSLDAASNQISVQNSGSGLPVPGSFFGLSAGDSITIAGATTPANNGTFTISSVAADGSTLTLNSVNTSETVVTTSLTSPTIIATPMVFNANGKLSTPQSFTLTGTWSDGATSSFTIDMSEMIQLAGDFTPFSFSQNGLTSANLSRVQFDDRGQVIGTFDDGTVRTIYKIPLARFSNPNGLQAQNGTVFAETALSGVPTLEFTDVSGTAQFNPFSVELSNVDLAGEFTKMIMVQQAYNSSATVFRTVDEMTIIARDLKT